MKIKNFIKTLLAGMAIGFGSAVPGVSGGTIAVIFGVYKKIIWAVSNIFKKFKESIIVLLPTLIGVVVALIPTIVLMFYALDYFLFGIVCIFAGFIIGSFPGIKDEVKGVKPNHKHIIVLVIALLIAVGLGVASALGNADLAEYIFNAPIWMYFVMIPVGLVASVALVVPGLSGGMILLLMGFYKPLIDFAKITLSDCLHGDWSNFGSLVGIVGCFAIGAVVGFYLVSKLMHYLLAKHHDITFYGIMGFVIGSVIALFYNYNIKEHYIDWSNGTAAVPLYIEIPIGIVLLIVTIILSYLLVRYKRKIEAQEATENEQN